MDFTRKKFLGRGSFGTVYSGEVKQDGKALHVALKMPLDYDVGDNPSEAEMAAAKAAQRKVEEVPKLIFTDAYRLRLQIGNIRYPGSDLLARVEGFSEIIFVEFYFVPSRLRTASWQTCIIMARKSTNIHELYANRTRRPEPGYPKL